LVNILNNFINFIRNEGNSKEFINILKNYRRLQNKNTKSLKDYITKLFALHSRLLVIKIDLSYANDNDILKQDEREKFYANYKDILKQNEKENFYAKDKDIVKQREKCYLEKCYLQVKLDLKRLIKDMNVNPIFEHKVGYIWKLEHGLEKGFHIQFLIFFQWVKVL